MIRYCFVSLVFLGVFAGSASAQVQCSAPFLPVVPDGATATEEQMDVTRRLVETFMSDSEDYQKCIVLILSQAEGEAISDDEEPNPALRRRAIARVESNQGHKVRVSEEFNEAANAYNEANPIVPEPADPPES